MVSAEMSPGEGRSMVSLSPSLACREGKRPVVVGQSMEVWGRSWMRCREGDADWEDERWEGEGGGEELGFRMDGEEAGGGYEDSLERSCRNGDIPVPVEIYHISASDKRESRRSGQCEQSDGLTIMILPYSDGSMEKVVTGPRIPMVSASFNECTSLGPCQLVDLWTQKVADLPTSPPLTFFTTTLTSPSFSTSLIGVYSLSICKSGFLIKTCCTITCPSFLGVVSRFTALDPNKSMEEGGMGKLTSACRGEIWVIHEMGWSEYACGEMTGWEGEVK